MDPVFLQISLAIAGGVIPAFVWLFFWLREDQRHPEPRWLIYATFFAGMVVVLPVFKAETLVHDLVSNETFRLFVWSAIEELGKFFAAYVIALRRKETDEPIDYTMYLITAALGFAAVENTLFIYAPLSEGLAAASIITGNLRFIGATLLHVGTAAVIGIAMAFAFYKNARYKRKYLGIGLILAIALHTAFNLSIMINDGAYSLLVAALVWSGMVAVLLILEKVKKIHPIKR